MELMALGAQLRTVMPAQAVAGGVLGPALAGAGLEEVSGAAVEFGAAAPLNGRRRGADGGDEPSLTVSVPAPPPGRGQVLLVEDGGTFRWVLPDVAVAGSRRGGPELMRFTVSVAGSADEEDVSRGFVGVLAKRVLRVLMFDLLDKVAGEVGDFFVRRWEESARPHRLRTFTAADHDKPGTVGLDEAAVRRLADGPSLLVIHGINSLTHTCFAGLPVSVVDGLHERYGGRVFAFDHPTLSVDPVENCRQLMELDPGGCRARSRCARSFPGRACCPFVGRVPW